MAEDISVDACGKCILCKYIYEIDSMSKTISVEANTLHVAPVLHVNLITIKDSLLKIYL